MAHAGLAAARWYVRHAPGTMAKARLAAWADQRLQEQGRRFMTTTRSGARVTGTTTDLLQRYLYEFGVWEPNLTAWISARLRPGDVFIDVGANVGYYSLLAAPLVGPTGMVVAIEASPSIFRSLLDNLANNDTANVRAINVAAADRPRTLPVWLADPVHLGATTTADSRGRTWEAQVVGAPLTEILTVDEQRRCRLIKVDVEGFEGPVVRGLLPMLADGRPDLELVVEVNGSQMPVGDSADQIVEQLAECSFHAYAIDNDYAPAAYGHRRHPKPPTRLRSPVGVRPTDLVFSRIDAAAL